MAFSLTTAAWGGITFRQAYEDAGELQHMISCIKFPTEYLIKAHTAKYELVGQVWQVVKKIHSIPRQIINSTFTKHFFKVGHGKTDHDSWGRPEQMTLKRPAYKITAKKPGTELAGETAAALAAASVFLRPYDPVLANEAVKHAKEIYEFADKYR